MSAAALNWLVRVAHLNRAVVWGLSGKILAGLSGPITAILIAKKFSPELQGYHYTFFSLLALQVFVELGLSGVITTFASHEWAKLSLNERGRIEGDPVALSRLSSLAALGFRWFVAAAVFFTILLAVGGYFFLSTKSSLGPQIHWQGPWIGLCILTGLNLAFVPAWAILQGCEQVERIYFYRFVEMSLRYPAVWVALLMGAQLWTGLIASAIGTCWALGFLWRKYRHFLASLRYAEKSESVDWKHDILPLQWRIALSWISGYFMFSLFTPALFHFQGPVVAGQFGMTWALISGVSGLAGTWLQVKVPEFGALVSQKKFQALDQIVRKTAMISFWIAILGGALLLGIILILDYYSPALRLRLLPMLPIGIFIFAEALNQVSSVQSSYLRSFKREPFLVLSVVMGSTVGISTIICAKYFGVTGISFAYLAAVLIGLGWGTFIFSECRREWTGQALHIGRSLAVLSRPLKEVLLLVPVLVLKSLGVRFLWTNIDRIGHLACDVDCYIKERQLGLVPQHHAILLAPKDKVANKALLGYWCRYIRAISSPWLCKMLNPLASHRLLRLNIYEYTTAINETAPFYGIQRQWGGRPPLLSLKQEDVARGEKCLLQLGLPPGAWFVCVHSREGGYSVHDEHFHSHRNSAIESYQMAMKAIVDRGGWCIRIGDPSMKKMSPMRNTIDYAHSPLKSDWMDLFLFARCRFFLGNSSGPFLVASAFGVPVALANQSPVSVVLPYGGADIGIPKLIWSEKDQRLLAFPEILGTSIGDLRLTHEHEQAGISVIDNTTEDIRDLALEQLDRVEGRLTYDPVDEALQAKFKGLMRPGHYSYGSDSRVGRAFLKKHVALL
ncbi:MAG: TIGR04372 family glycosyltransferase [Sideroxydans sp.]|nr:TIGR04372 family glycosyltransferase [Sideroxydans sp.]